MGVPPPESVSQNPANLVLRVLLEVGALWLLGAWGWGHNSLALPLRLGLAVAVPGVAAVAWAVFRVPNDGGDPVVTVPGPARLALEAAVLGGAAVGAVAAGRNGTGLAFGALVAVHYLLSWDRTARLLRG